MNSANTTGVSPWKFIAQKDVIAQLSDLKEAARRLSDIKINQITRQTPAEALYDLLVYFENTGQRLLENTYTWTSKCDDDGKLIIIGGFQPRGIMLHSRKATEILLHTGVCFSRRF